MERSKPFWILISNFAKDQQLLSKNMVIATGNKIPIVTTEIPGPMGRELAECLNIVEAND